MLPHAVERTRRKPKASRAWLPTAGWGAMALLSVAVAGVSSRYFLPHPPEVAEMLRARVAAHDPWIYVHIAGGVVSLFVGAFQFSRQLRMKSLALHRWVGRIYLGAVAVGGLAAFRMALESFGGLSTHFGFGMLAVLWVATTAVAYRRILQRRIQSHREWMIRSFALTFAAVTLRIWIPLAMAVHLDFTQAYQTISWLCWVPNMLVAEMLVSRSRLRVVL
jgi:hypothetical protein